MPTYQYKCSACDYEFELMQSIIDSAKKKCPTCGKMKLKRLIGAGSAVIFKGSGFHCNDYKSDNYKQSVEKKPVFSNKTIKKGPAKTQI
jgi:putative FmdB family regulatory protein